MVEAQDPGGPNHEVGKILKDAGDLNRCTPRRERFDNEPVIERFNPSTVHEPAGYAGRLVYRAGQCPLDLSGQVVGAPGDFTAPAWSDR